MGDDGERYSVKKIGQKSVKSLGRGVQSIRNLQSQLSSISNVVGKQEKNRSSSNKSYKSQTNSINQNINLVDITQYQAENNYLTLPEFEIMYDSTVYFPQNHYALVVFRFNRYQNNKKKRRYAAQQKYSFYFDVQKMAYNMRKKLLGRELQQQMSLFRQQ